MTRFVFAVATMLCSASFSIADWPSFLAGQQARLVALDPASAPVLLSLNAAAIYIGAAIGSAIGGAVIARSGLSGLGWTASALAVIAVLHMVISARVSEDHKV